MNIEMKNASHPPTPHDKGNTLYWISQMTDIPEIQDGTEESARKHLSQWWKYSTDGISELITELPEEFRTTRIWRQISYVENYSMRLKPIFAEMDAETCGLDETVDRLWDIFSEEEDRLRKWKDSLGNIQGLILWLPTFSHAREYLLASFPLGQEDADTLRQSLIRSIRDPYPFLEAGTRERFDESFLEFKKNYIETYSSLHEAMRNAIQDVEKEESKMNPVAIRNLELLSRLQYTDKSYLNRINILASWIKRNQCTLPASHILERYPRCYCNFNPCSIRQPAAPVNQINEIVHEGIQYFRTVLLRCRDKIEKEAKLQNMDKSFLSQIDTHLEDDSTILLKEETIEGINLIFRKHPQYFHSKILSKTE